MIQLNRQTDEGVSWSGNERNVVFLNLGCQPAPGSPPDFADVSALSGFDFPDDARALASIDWDFDGDVNLIDWAFFQICFTGEDVTPYEPGCETFDFDLDEDVDLFDFGEFQEVFGGPGQ